MAEEYVRCLMVETGFEGIVARLLQVRGLGQSLCPQRERVRKLRGVWRKDRIRILPGYVFVFTEEKIPIRYYQGSEHILKVLRYDREPNGYLKGADLEFAHLMQELDGKLEILDAIDEGGFIRITDDLVEQLHGEVISVDRGKRQAKVRTQLLGQTRILTMSYQLLNDQGEPVGPVDQWLDDETDEWLTAWTPDFSDELVDWLDAEESDGMALAETWEDPDAEAPESIAPKGYWEDLDAAAAADGQEENKEDETP